MFQALERTDCNQSAEQICSNCKGFCTVTGVIPKTQINSEEDAENYTEFPLKSHEYFSF